VNGNSTCAVRVEAGGTQVVAHVGLHALGRFADRVGLGTALSAAVPWSGERAPLHDRGTVLTQAMLMLAGGGESCADIEHLRTQDSLFGDVASDSTLYRTITAITATILTDLNTATGSVRSVMWQRMAATTGNDRVVLDIDASLVEIHSENKTGTAPTYKGGFGFAPMFCFADATGEALAGLLRPGNAAANTVTDHLTVLDTAIGQLPPEIAAGHHLGDDKSAVRRPVQVRTDSAGCTRGFVDGCRERNIGFAVVARQIPKIHTAIGKIRGNDRRWQRATRSDGNRPVPRCRVHRSGRPVGLADRHQADHPPREVAPRRATLPVPVHDLPLLGALHRHRRQHPSGARRAHESPCSR
jgi:Transposase DDE domain group 1